MERYYMATNAMFITTDSWNAELYGSLSVSSRLSAAIKSGTALLKILYFLNRANNSLGDMLNKIDKGMDDAQRGKTKPSTPGGPDRQTIEKTTCRLDELYRLLDGIHAVCRQHRVQNVSLLAPGMAKLRRNADRVSELADWLRDMLDPAGYRDAFANALREFENGEAVPASEVWR